MVLTRRAAKKLEEEEKKKTLVDGCQDAKIAVEHDAENLQPQKQKKVISKAKAGNSKRRSLAPAENEQTSEETQESPKQGLPVPIPASPLAEVTASPPLAGSPSSQKGSQNFNATKNSVVDDWEDLFVPEVATEQEKQAVEEVVVTESTSSTTPAVPAFIAALAKKREEAKETTDDDVDVTDHKELKNLEDINIEEAEGIKTSDDPRNSPPKQRISSSISEGTGAEQPERKQEDSFDPESEEEDTEIRKNNKHKPKKDKSFQTLHATKKDCGTTTKHRAPAPHHQDIVHPAPAALVEAVQMSADSLQAQLDALTLGPNSTPNRNNSGGFGNQRFSSSASVGTPYFQRNPESTASVIKNLAALSSQLHRLTLCVGTLQQEIAAAAIPEIPDAVGRHFLALDTCALMQRNPELDALIDALIRQGNNSTNFGITKRISVLIPLEIVRELDGLKESRDEKRRAFARKAISLLGELQRASNNNGQLKDDNTVLLYRGQRQNELLGPYARRGDDGILDCLVLFKNAGAAEINLVTQDNNFALRAQTEGFKAMTVVQALQFVRSFDPSYRQKPAPTSSNVPVRVVRLPVSFLSIVKMGQAAGPPPPPPPPPPTVISWPRSTVVEKNNTSSAVAPASRPPPPPGLPTLSFSRPHQPEDEYKTPIAKQPPPASSPRHNHIAKTPIVWTPLPPHPAAAAAAPAPAPIHSELLNTEVPQTVSAAPGAATVAATPATINRYKTVNGKLVRPPGLEPKQWRNYKTNYRHKMKKQAQSIQKSNLHSRIRGK